MNNKNMEDKHTVSLPPESSQPVIKDINSNPKNILNQLLRKIIKHKFALPVAGFIVIILSLATISVFIKPNNFSSSLTNLKNKLSTNKQNSPRFQIGDYQRLQIPEREPPFFDLKTTTADKFGIQPQEKFILTTNKPVETQFISQHLQTTTPVNISTQDNRHFTLTPRTPLGVDQIFKIKLLVNDQNYQDYQFDRDYSWAYQTQGKFRVINHLPGNQKTKVPIDTGIEIIFSQDDYQDLQPFISIKPSVKYKLERHQQTLAIVPLQPLQPQTVYTVTLKSGLNLISRNDPIDQDLQFSFQTAELPVPTKIPSMSISLRKNLIQTNPQQLPQIQVYTRNKNNNQSIRTQVYRFPTSRQFIESRQQVSLAAYSWYDYFSEKDTVSTENLSLIAEFDLRLKTQKGKNKYLDIEYLEIPETLPSGYYLIKLWYQDQQKFEQLWLQSSPLGGYVNVGKKHSLVWINRLDNGQPGTQASINPVGLASIYQTNDQGWTIFNTPELFFQTGEHYLQITQNNDQLILPVRSLSSQPTPNQLTASDYWSYLYQERKLYKPNDTIHFWGVIKNRHSDQPPSTIQIGLSSGYSNQDEPQLKLSQQITPRADGSFIGKINLSELPPGWYQLQLNANEIQITSSGFSVEAYTKPEMNIEVTADKRAIFTDQKITYTALVKFFDNTPASNIPLDVYAQYGGKLQTLTTDQFGQASYTYQPKYNSDSNYPRLETITFSPTKTQAGIIEGYGSVKVYGSKLMITTQKEQNQNQATFRATINRIDLTQSNQGISNPKLQGSPANNQTVNLTITKTWYKKIETGTYYDFIEKITRPKYTYQRRKETVTNQTLTTDSQGQIHHQFNMEQNKSYQAKLTAIDQDQHPTSKSEYYYYYPHSNNYNQNLSDSNNPTLKVDKSENFYSLGETVSATIELNDQPYPDNDQNRFLFITANQGQQQVVVANQPQYSFTFSQQHIPNIYLGGLIFTGQAYQSVVSTCQWGWQCKGYGTYDDNYFDGLLIKYQTKDSKLDLSLQTSQLTYKPSGKAVIQINVTDLNQQPIPNATVNLVLVDQALAAIGGVRKPSILSSLYSTIPHNIYFSYYTHKSLLPLKSMAEKGGGGGDRQIFKDSAFFGQSTTNDQGIAQFEFDLPDNITTWITYGQAVTADLQAGQLEGRITVTQDFFITSHFPPHLLVADKAFVTASAFGINLQPETQINYQMLLSQNNQQIQQSQKSQNAFQPLDFPLPDLTTGNYQISVRAQTDSQQDGLQLPLQVTDSRIAFPYSTSYQLSPGKTLPKFDTSQILANQPVKLIVSDIGKGQYYNQLNNFCYTSSNRLEKQLVRFQAHTLLQQYFEEQTCQLDLEKFTQFQNHDGGLSQVSWGESILDTSMWAAYVSPSSFDKTNLIKYFNQQLNDPKASPIQQLQALWGLTSLGQPTITQLRLLADQASSFEEKILVGLALASAGETEIARNLYYDILADYAYVAKPYIRIQVSDKNNQLNQDNLLKHTGWALLLGSLVESQYNQGMHIYLQDYQSTAQDIVLDLAKMGFINHQLNQLPEQDTQIQFNTSTRNITKTLAKGRSWTTNIAKEELDNFKLQTKSGKAEATLRYQVGSSGLQTLATDPRLQLTRTYQPINKDHQQILSGDIIRVQLHYQLDPQNSPLGEYIIIDQLPSGFTYLKNPKNYGLTDNDYVTLRSPKQINHTFYNSLWRKKFSDTITYYVRSTAIGQYRAEPAILQSARTPSVFTKTENQTVTIISSEL